MNIDQIELGFRYRRDLGDLRMLAESIEGVGLLHSVVVTPDGPLIAALLRLDGHPTASAWGCACAMENPCSSQY
jgi:hypothetical protein